MERKLNSLNLALAGKGTTSESTMLHLETSLDLLQHASRLIPGASLTRSKAPGALYGEYEGPLYAWHGEGATITDADGNKYLDMLCGLGAISLGYQVPERSGFNFCPTLSLPTRHEADLAHKVIGSLAPWADMVRFTKTGSEAVQGAVVCARAATGRHDVLVAQDSYHGWHSMFQQGDVGYYRYASEPGWITEETALVLIEPSRWEYTPTEWIRDVIKAAHAMGALVAIDEMVYGMRYAMGGATELYNVTPDFACYGKALGNGYPIACFVGKETVMKHATLVSGTYSGETNSLLAGSKVLDFYGEHNVVDHMWRIGRAIEHGLDAVVEDTGVYREGAAVHQRLVFPGERDKFKFASGMAKRGILWHPDVMNVCYSHTMADADRVVGAAQSVICEMGLL